MNCCRPDLWPDPEPMSHDYANVPTLEEIMAEVESEPSFWVFLADALITALDEQ